MSKSITFMVALFVMFCSYGQNYNSLYTYESINGIEEEEVKEAKKVKTKESTKSTYLSLSELMSIEKQKGKSIKTQFRKNSVVITKAKKVVLIRFNGEYSSLQLVDFKGGEIDAYYNKEYKGLVLPRVEEEQKYFLKAKSDNGKTSYHRVNL